MDETARISGRADLLCYLDHFNHRRYAQQTAYYAPDVRYRVGTLTIASPGEIAGFYADFHAHCREHVALADFAMSGDSVAAVLPTRFEPFRDYDRHGLRFTAGQVVEIVTFAFYRLAAGRIRRIRMARYAGSATDFDD
ncbi:MAG: nuclear transport factor 2 family protein [Gammaproteobacteria bacterium]|nr:nuclear transport factor 2 family protein [Gammaproteobacteria bacterium]